MIKRKLIHRLQIKQIYNKIYNKAIFDVINSVKILHERTNSNNKLEKICSATEIYTDKDVYSVDSDSILKLLK